MRGGPRRYKRAGEEGSGPQQTKRAESGGKEHIGHFHKHVSGIFFLKNIYILFLLARA